MTRWIVASVFGAVVVACSGAPAGPVVVDEPGRVVVVQAPPGPAMDVDGGPSADDAGPSAPDANDASVPPDAAPMTCAGPDPIGAPSDNCEARGPCMLSTCTVGEAFTCSSGSGPASGYPKGQVGCVASAADDTSLGLGAGHANCCARECVRRSSDDGACNGTAFNCPSGVVPTAPFGTTCTKYTAMSGDYCCR